jgi:hypothetical protein
VTLRNPRNVPVPIVRAAGRAALTLALTTGLVGCSNPLERRASAGADLPADAPVSAPVPSPAILAAAAPVAVAAPTPTPDPTTSAAAEPSSATEADTSLPARPLAPGKKPPQFVVISFDGAGSLDRWKYYRNIAKEVGAHLTYYLSGTYLVPKAKSGIYNPPLHKPGASDIGWAESGTDVRARMAQAYAAYEDGNEIGTHFNGHFCGAGGGLHWTAADWRSELTQWFTFLHNWRANADSTDADPVPFKDSAIVGERTPCLEDKPSVLFPVLKEMGFRYDTSDTGYLQWPQKDSATGIWEIPLQDLRAAGTGMHVLSMDYNFYDMQTHAVDGSPALYPAYQRQVLDTYRNAYQAVYHGNRAPLILGDHFANWNHGIYTQALGQFISETCNQPETKCVTFTELVNWMEAQSPETLRGLQALPVQQMSK